VCKILQTHPRSGHRTVVFANPYGTNNRRSCGALSPTRQRGCLGVLSEPDASARAGSANLADASGSELQTAPLQEVPLMRPASRSIMLSTLATLCCTATGPAGCFPLPSQSERPDAARQSPALEVRMGFEQLRNPYWYEANGHAEEAR